MPSAFFGLEIAKRALAMSQLNLQVIAHNIANAGTPGYSRQRAEIITTPPLVYPSISRPSYPQQIGTGVDVNSIKRIRDEFLDEIIRSQTGYQGRNSVVSNTITSIELIFNEPGETGLTSALDDFFAAWQDLANDPELVSTRANLRESAISLTREMGRINTDMKRLASDLLRQLKYGIKEANTLAHQIADLNIQISQVKGLGDDPNDLMDQRDLLVEELAKIVPINTIEQLNGSMSVLIGGLRIVESDTVQELVLTSNPANPELSTIKLQNGKTPDLKGAGSISGILESQREIIPYFQDKLKEFTSGIINRINLQHRKGFGLDGTKGRPFFSDYRTAEMMGTVTLPADTTINTKLDELGITAGTFQIEGATITITSDDIVPGKAITLEKLLDRINEAQPNVRAELSANTSGAPVLVLGLYNPPDVTDEIAVQAGNSNFLQVMGLHNATTNFLSASETYSTSLDKFEVAMVVLENLNVIAAAGDDGSGIYPGSGNNLNALAISNLQSFDNAVGGASLSDFLVAAITELGSQGQTISRLMTNQDVLLEQLNVQRESVMGVNLDEEATLMITYQRIYEGAARVIQVVDSMLDTLINRTGA